MKYYDIPNKKFDLYGIMHDKNNGFFRLPPNIAQMVSKEVVKFGMNTSGGRIRFRTNSKYLDLVVEYNAFEHMSHMALLGSSGFVLLEEKNDYKTARILPPKLFENKGYHLLVKLGNGEEMMDYTLFFPLYNNVQKLSIGLDDDAIVQNGKPYRDILPILYYGSSITQGACASRPDKNYPSLINKWNNIDFINLGFSESGKAEEIMVNYLASIDCSIFVCDYDYNAPTVEYLQNTHRRLYELYRAKRPTTPILFISRADVHWDKSCKERFEVIKATYDYAKANGDNNVYIINGADTYAGEDRDSCLVDEIHPNDFGFYRYAKAVYNKLKEISEDFI